MDDRQQYLQPEVLAKLKGLDLKARLIVEGYVAGLHRSPYHGFSVEFAEHREYVPGDDLRYVDWKVYGKSDRIYLKQFEEETNFACHLLVDTSESMQYQSAQAPLSKLEYARCVAAALGYLVVHQQDAVGLATFDRQISQFLRPLGTPSHLRQVLHRLEQTPATGETSLGPILHDLAERIRKRGVVILLSDLFDDVDSLMLGLKHFRHRRHDISVMQVIDPAEQDFPFDEPTLFKGLEGMPERMTDPRALRKGYQAEFEAFLKNVRRGCADMQMDYVLLRTDMSLDVALRSFLTRRMQRAGRT
ncbi:MAG: DUF58 domain-containing protein [Planctomycetaceae bacterium]|nr:DUF58 domain-containing protein [Planctomycetaceae bacterium]